MLGLFLWWIFKFEGSIINVGVKPTDIANKK